MQRQLEKFYSTLFAIFALFGCNEGSVSFKAEALFKETVTPSPSPFPSSSSSSGALASLAYFVSPLGNDSNNGLSPSTPFQTLQKAANVVTPGYTIYAMTGTYQNSDYFSASPGADVMTITTSGTAEAPITFTNFPGESPKIIFNSFNAINIEGGASYLVIGGFEITGNALGITLSQAQAASPFASLTAGVGIAAGRDGGTLFSSHITIQNMSIHDCSLEGIGMGPVDYVTIQDNVTYRNAYWSAWAGSGISLCTMWDSDNNTTTYKNIIQRNISYDNQEFVGNFQVGGMITDGNGIILDTFNNQGSGRAPYQGKTLVTNNIVYNNGGTGIHSYMSENIDLVNNTSFNNNLTQSNTSGQIISEFSSNVNVINNIMVAPSGKPVNSNMSNTNVTYDYNIYFGGTGPQITGPHDMVANPLFTNSAGSNFQLQSGSPALSSGTTSLAPSTDFLNNSRPTKGGVDRGAYQN